MSRTPTSGPVGTTVEVRNLFRYVPARRKFLKTDPTEMGHITEQVTRIALAYPAVHLAVTHNGRSGVRTARHANRSATGRPAFFGADLARRAHRDRVRGTRRAAVGPGRPAAGRPGHDRGPVSIHQR